MTTRAMTMCPTCGVPVQGQIYCDKHRRRYKDKRQSSHQRGYTWRWRQFALRYLQANPFCVDCLGHGKATDANEVHHIKKQADYPELKYELSNLMALCKTCHDRRSARGE